MVQFLEPSSRTHFQNHKFRTHVQNTLPLRTYIQEELPEDDSFQKTRPENHFHENLIGDTSSALFQAILEKALLEFTCRAKMYS